MKKAIKLPLFLGVTCLICTGVLALVNEVTAPVISENQVKAQNAGYLTLFGLESFNGFELSNPVVSDDLTSAGITGELEISQNNELYGIAYDGSVQGFSSKGDIVFQVGFRDGKYAGFVVISSQETPGYGASYLDILPGYLSGLSADTSLDTLETETIALKAGTTHTREGILPAIYAAAQDYLAVSE